MVNPWIEFMKATKGRGMTMDQKRVAYRRQQANVSVSVSKPNKAMLSQRRRLQYRSTGGGGCTTSLNAKATRRQRTA